MIISKLKMIYLTELEAMAVLRLDTTIVQLPNLTIRGHIQRRLLHFTHYER